MNKAWHYIVIAAIVTFLIWASNGHVPVYQRLTA